MRFVFKKKHIDNIHSEVKKDVRPVFTILVLLYANSALSKSFTKSFYFQLMKVLNKTSVILFCFFFVTIYLCVEDDKKLLFYA